jgi:predicted nucleotide-binding protein (sugar kinase/HSP70/actin superfamily)
VLESLGPEDIAMVVASRPYNGADPGINLGLPQKMKSLGVWSIPMDFLDLEAEIGAPELAEMYWRYGQKILASALIARRDPRLYPVYITNFGCGPDSFIGHFFAQIMKGKPYLEIEIDEHSADVGAITRLEAFLDSLKNSPAKERREGPVKRRQKAAEGRTIYIPAMTDHAHPVAAAFRANGMEAWPLAESDQRTLELGRRYTSGKECYPCTLTTGDMVKLLADGHADPDKAAFFMPSGRGPCRFGQYNRFQRMVLDSLGYEKVPIFSPDQSEELYQELGMVGGNDFVRLAWQGCVAVDLLQKALHQIRPYEARPGDTDRAYRAELERVSQAIARREDLPAALARAKEAFSRVPKTNGRRRPLVGIVGEIYTRLNRFANNGVVRIVEELGGEAWMAGFCEWMFYTNRTNLQRTMLLRQFGGVREMLLYNFFQAKDEHQLAKVWQGFLHHLEEAPVRRVVAMAKPYLSEDYEGEPILSVGKSREMLEEGADGIINVIPFTCMPGNIVNAVMKRFREDNGNLPYLAMAMDGQEGSGARTRLEAFMHQVAQRRDQRLAAGG